MGFKIPGKSKFVPSSPIELFNKLAKVERLSLQQGQSLEEYEKSTGDFGNIAIEMPAGHGKTLVGGLIGEYNRLAKEWRVVYCCATRQLANQTHSLLASYGINSVLLVGKSKDFPEPDFRLYSRSGAIAVTTYSHIFNINSKFPDANLIIFDDAHATEYAINDFWTLEINKYNEVHKDIFNSLFSIIKDILPLHIQDKIEFGNYDPLIDGIDIIPQPLWLAKLDDIRSYLDQATHNNDLYFHWTKVRNILNSCQFYISHNKFVIKPLITPNNNHPAFANANERIFMSATLGPIGELERVFGISKIHRITKFSKGANKVSGRRLILFPEDHFDKKEILNVLAETIRMQPRALILFSTKEMLNAFKDTTEKILPEYKIFLDTDVEDSLEEFRTSTNGLLLLSGRYEGIDLKDSDCRLQIFWDLPVGVGIPEQFLQTRLRANEILKNRLATRLIQGLGRCTRGTNDYAAVLFIGRRIGEYLYKNEFRKILPPEIDSELEFGFSQIEHIRDLDSWKNSLKTFFEQNKDWSEVEEYIKTETTTKQQDQGRLDTDTPIEEYAINEVNFQYFLLNRDLEKANREAHKILECLSRDKKYQGLRAWWNYQIACVTNQQGENDKAKKYLEHALSASANKLWIDKDLLQLQLPDTLKVYNIETESQLDRIIAKLLTYGDRDKRFEKDLEKTLNGLKEKKAELYEPALNELGEFLGLISYRPVGKGTPDGVWNLLNIWVAFEAKTNIEDPETEISLDDIRQAAFHKNWVIKHNSLKPDQEVPVCIICPKKFIQDYAEHASDNLYLIDPESIQDFAKNLGNILRETIQKIKFSSIEEAKEHLATRLIDNNLTIIDVVQWLKSLELKNVVREL